MVGRETHGAPMMASPYIRNPTPTGQAGIAADVARTGVTINVPFPAVQSSSFSIEIDRLPDEQVRLQDFRPSTTLSSIHNIFVHLYCTVFSSIYTVQRTGVTINVPFPAVKSSSFSIEIDRLPDEQVILQNSLTISRISVHLQDFLYSRNLGLLSPQVRNSFNGESHMVPGGAVVIILHQDRPPFRRAGPPTTFVYLVINDAG